MKDIWLIRHGESKGNAGERTKNTKVNPLSNRGWREARKLGHYLNDNAPKPGLIVISEFKRTVQTSTPYRDLNDNIPVEEWPVQEFTYLSGVKYANTCEAERIPKRNEYWEQNDPYYHDDENSESFVDFYIRANEMIEKAYLCPHDFIIIFTHGMFSKMIWWIINNKNLNGMAGCNALTMEQWHNFNHSIDFPNTGILKIRIDDGDVWISGDRVHP